RRLLHHPTTSRLHPLSLHAALPICADTVHVLALSAGSLERRSSLAFPPGTGPRDLVWVDGRLLLLGEFGGEVFELDLSPRGANGDRKSTRLNSSHAKTSYAVFWLKK